MGRPFVLAFVVIRAFLFGISTSHAQSALVDLPRDSQHATVTQRIGITDITINYHRPLVKGRQIWGKVVPYGEIWRAGAIENTTITIDPVTIEGRPLARGTYGLHMLPGKDQWTVIFSKVHTAWEWPLTMSSPERAILELLNEAPERETFHQADVLMEGLRNLSPRRVQTLLVACRSVKVKRLFLWFAERHQHAWLKKLDRKHIDLGRGKRMLVRGGKLDPTYNITVPESIDAGG